MTKVSCLSSSNTSSTSEVKHARTCCPIFPGDGEMAIELGLVGDLGLLAEGGAGDQLFELFTVALADNREVGKRMDLVREDDDRLPGVE